MARSFSPSDSPPQTPFPFGGVFSFQRACNRIKAVTGSSTEARVALQLGLSADAPARARQADSVPREWLETLLDVYRALPLWVLFGREPRFLRQGEILEADRREQLLREALEAQARAPRPRSVSAARASSRR